MGNWQYINYARRGQWWGHGTGNTSIMPQEGSGGGHRTGNTSIMLVIITGGIGEGCKTGHRADNTSILVDH